MRFVGQRVAAVVAETEGAAEEACRLLEVEYELLPTVFDPERAMEPGAPILHEKKSVALAAAILLVRQINVALARLGILNASIQRSVSAQICRGRAAAQVEVEMEVAARAQGLRQLAVVMDRPSSAVCAKRTPTAATISVVRGTFVNHVDQGVRLEVPRAQ